MAQAFPRTTRALALDTRLWPLSMLLGGFVLLCAWGVWFTAAGLPTYAVSRAVMLAGPPLLRTVETRAGGTIRYETRRVWPMQAVFPHALRQRIERGQQAVVRIDEPTGRVHSLPATVADARGLDGGPGIGLDVIATEDVGALFRAADRIQARIVIGRQSPLQRMLAGSGLGTDTPAVTAVSQRP